MKNDREQSRVFDEALPERFLPVSETSASHSLPIDRGAAAPSPYIVKLSRDEIRQQTSPVTAEIEALAKSLIIDGDDADLPVSEHEDDLSLDISEQLREFDTALPMSAPKASSRVSVGESALVVPSVSLDEALELLAEPAISLAEFVPERSPEPEVILQDVSVESALEEPGKEEAPRSRWVFGGSSSQARDEISFEPRVIDDSPWRRVFRFEVGVFRHASVRALGAFVLLSFAVVLPLHAMQTLSGSVGDVSQAKSVSVAALDDVARATNALSAQDFGSAQADFSSAAEKFAQAQETLDSLHAGVVALVNVIPQTSRTYDSVRGLMTAGQELAETASIMSKAGEGVLGGSTDIVSKLGVLSAYVENAKPHAEAASAALGHIDASIVPEGYANQVAQLQSQVPEIVKSMEEFTTFVGTLSHLLGGDGTMRYLALFQNNTELRPTGGFVGSFAEVDLDEGAITNIALPGGGTYDVQGQLDAFVEAPKPLQLINPRWEFQDGNWFPDFPTSAKKMQWFYEHAGGPTTDGVVSVNATFLEKLLDVLGPVELPKYGVTIDAENFLFTTEKIVEVDNGTTAAPKAFLGDLAPILLEKIQSADTKTLLRIIVAVEAGLADRDIQLYFRDNDAERAMKEFGYDGSVAQTSGDYLMVVNTNIGGGKTDAVIDQKVDVQVHVADDGSIVDDVTITKTHRGMANALFTGKNNVDYLRLYVPQGSMLISADGFEVPPASLFEASDVPLSADDDLSLITRNLTKDASTGVDIWDEFGKTVFGGWMQTAPGETQVVHFSYKIPKVLFANVDETSFMSQIRQTLGFTSHDAYSMFIQKQSGVMTRNTTVELDLPLAYKTLWTNVLGEDTTTITTDNARDSYSGWIFTK